MARSPLTPTIQRVQGMITYVQENLSTDEFNLFLDLLVPEPEPEQTPVKAKRGRKKKTTTAAPAKKRGLPTDATPLLSTAPTQDEEDDGPRCHVCNHGEHYQDHSKPSPHYHEFKTAA